MTRSTAKPWTGCLNFYATTSRARGIRSGSHRGRAPFGRPPALPTSASAHTRVVALVTRWQRMSTSRRRGLECPTGEIDGVARQRPAQRHFSQVMAKGAHASESNDNARNDLATHAAQGDGIDVTSQPDHRVEGAMSGEARSRTRRRSSTGRVSNAPQRDERYAAARVLQGMLQLFARLRSCRESASDTGLETRRGGRERIQKHSRRPPAAARTCWQISTLPPSVANNSSFEYRSNVESNR